METYNDVIQNGPSFLQQGDFVASSFFIVSLALGITTLFLLLQVNYVHKKWRNLVILGAMVTLVAAVNAFYRRDFWVHTHTNPTEFRFFDWFLTVPLMCISFYMLVRPLGAKIRMFLFLIVSSIWMLIWGYLGEAIYKEQSFLFGCISILGFAGIIATIMAEGYPKVFGYSKDPALRTGYLALSIFLPLGWSIYPFCYLTVPGNLLEGAMSTETVSLLYNIADGLNKIGLGLGLFLIASLSNHADFATPTAVNTNGQADPLSQLTYDVEKGHFEPVKD